MSKISPTDLVSYHEIIERTRDEFGVELRLGTVRQWEKYRRAWVEQGSPVRSEARPRDIPMPTPVTAVNRTTPVWVWSQVREWLIRSERVGVSQDQPAAGA